MTQYGTYCTQIGPDGSGHERCGGAALASVVLNNGWQSDPWALTVEISDKYGFTDRGATSAQIIDAAADYGLAGRMWYLVEDLKEALGQGEAVLWLLDNQYLEPRPYPMDYGWEAMHWIRTLHVSPYEELAYVYDPLCYMVQKSGAPYQGPTASTVDSLLSAVRATPYAEAGVVLTSLEGRDLNRLAA